MWGTQCFIRGVVKFVSDGEMRGGCYCFDDECRTRVSFSLYFQGPRRNGGSVMRTRQA